MTDTEINIAIAELLPDYYPEEHDFCHDLNAMHEALLSLNQDQLVLYVDSLLCLMHDVDRGYFDRITWQDAAEMTCATARQRAEAFLRTIGRWKE